MVGGVEDGSRREMIYCGERQEVCLRESGALRSCTLMAGDHLAS